MKTCAACRYENPAIANFCMMCGTALARPCANCGELLPAGARFCSGCGQPVAETSAAEAARLSRVSSAAPTHLTEKLRDIHLTGERKIVTAMFADVVNSTSLAGSMDFEEWTAIMNGAFDRFAAAIYRYEGTIARLLGDAILAFFGAPLAHEDDPIRAVHAALGVLTEAREYAEELHRERGIEFAVRIGLNTGPVFVGAVGSDLRFEYTALGDAVNLASRLQSAAEPNTVVISETTRRFIARHFDCRDLGELQVKGKLEPVRVYAVQAASGVSDASPTDANDRRNPLIGREAELGALSQLSAAAYAGVGGSVTIVAEPGLGKSRLVSAWIDADQATDSGIGAINWTVVRCASFRQGAPYHLAREVTLGVLGLTAHADRASIAAKVEAVVQDLAPEDAAIVRRWLTRLIAPGGGASNDRVDSETLQAGYLAALRIVSQAATRKAPVGIVIDDAQWADPSSVALIAKLCPDVAAAKIMLVVAARPDTRAPGWRLVEALDRVNGQARLVLAPLDAADMRQLLVQLLEGAEPSTELANLLLEKAEGNPYYLTELVKAMQARGAVVQRDGVAGLASPHVLADVPDSVQGLLAARVDQLPDAPKQLLRLASVLGRSFSRDLLNQLWLSTGGATRYG